MRRSLLVLLVLTISLASCGKKSKSPAKNATPPTDQSAPPAPGAAPKAEGASDRDTTKAQTPADDGGEAK
ncbi:MAG TPA: hypothetical protein VK427_01535 [Kofleriaceae bacterium]|nr:hypothetical protein [Kofleriaceae bacterium]